MKSFILLTWKSSKAACERLVVNGTPNWRLPSHNEFMALLNTYKPWGAAKPGAALEWLGWINATHWTSRVVGEYWYGVFVPDDPNPEDTWPDHPFLAACVR